MAAETDPRDWWSFKPAINPVVPSTTSASTNPIDQFLAAKRAEQKLPSFPEADRRTLLRRVTFNLTGLPPRPK